MNTPDARIYLCHGPFCHGESLRHSLEQAIREAGLDASCEIRPSGCQSRCDDGPNLTIWPGPFRYCHLTHANIRTIITHHLVHRQLAAEHLHPSSIQVFPDSE